MSNTRRRNRIKAVLPVRVSGSDSAGNSYSDVVHTLDITESGARLGAILRQLQVGSLLVLQYKQHKAEFRVVWIKLMASSKEHQIGLEAVAPKDVWGLGWSAKTDNPSHLANLPASETRGCPA